MIDDIEKVFREHHDSLAEPQHISPWRRLHRRPDVNAMLLLDKLVPGGACMIADVSLAFELILEVTPDELAEAKDTTEEDVVDLIRCGVIMKGDKLRLLV